MTKFPFLFKPLATETPTLYYQPRTNASPITRLQCILFNFLSTDFLLTGGTTFVVNPSQTEREWGLAPWPGDPIWDILLEVIPDLGQLGIILCILSDDQDDQHMEGVLDIEVGIVLYCCDKHGVPIDNVRLEGREEYEESVRVEIWCRGSRFMAEDRWGDAIEWLREHVRRRFDEHGEWRQEVIG